MTTDQDPPLTRGLQVAVLTIETDEARSYLLAPEVQPGDIEAVSRVFRGARPVDRTDEKSVAEMKMMVKYRLNDSPGPDLSIEFIGFDRVGRAGPHR